MTSTTTTSSTSSSTSSTSLQPRRSRSRSPFPNQQQQFDFSEDEEEVKENKVTTQEAFKLLSEMLNEVQLRDKPTVPQPTDLDKWRLKGLKNQIPSMVNKRKKLLSDIKTRMDRLVALIESRSAEKVPPSFNFEFEPRVPESHKDIADKMLLLVKNTKLSLLDMCIESKERTLAELKTRLTTTNLALMDPAVVSEFSEHFRNSARSQYHAALDAAYQIDDARFKIKQDIAEAQKVKANAVALKQAEAVQHAVADHKETIGSIVDRKVEALRKELLASTELHAHSHSRPVTVVVNDDDGKTKNKNNKNNNRKNNKKDTKNDSTSGGRTNNQVNKQNKKSQKKSHKNKSQTNQKQSGQRQDENKHKSTKRKPNTANSNNRNDSGNQRPSSKKRGKKSQK